MKTKNNKFNFYNSQEVFNVTEATSKIQELQKYSIIDLDYSLLDKEKLEECTRIVKAEMTNYEGSEIERKIHNKMLSDCASGDITAKIGVKEKIKKIIEQDHKLAESAESELIVKKIFEDNYGLGCIDDLITDSTVNEIFVNGYDSIWVEISGEMIKTNRQFKNDEDVIRVMSIMLKSDNKNINYNNPHVEAKLKNGNRLTFSIPPIAKRPLINIRKFDAFEVTTENLIEAKTVNKEMVEFLSKIIKGRANILIIGDTGTGKTSFLKWLVDFMNPNLRIGTIETDFELNLDEKYGSSRNIFSYETHPELGINMGDIFRMCLRRTPDIIIVGEARGSEDGLELLKSMRRGHPGSIGSFHTNSQYTAIDDFATMINEDGTSRNDKELKYMIATGVNFIIRLKKFKDDKRRVVTNITEIKPDEETRTYELINIFDFEVDKVFSENASKGRFVKANKISEQMKTRLNNYGLSYDEMNNM